MEIRDGYTGGGMLRHSRMMTTRKQRVRERVSQNEVCMKRLLGSLRSCNPRKVYKRIW